MKGSIIPPALFATHLVKQVQPHWGRITSGKIDIRYELLNELCIDQSPNGQKQLRPGIPGLYLHVCAHKGDQTAYDLLVALCSCPTCKRPRRPGGRPLNSARDFVVDLLSQLLIIQYPDLFAGANDATAEGVSAIDMIRKAIEDCGLGCIDYRGGAKTAPIPRSMERAVRRFREHPRYREIYWDY